MSKVAVKYRALDLVCLKSVHPVVQRRVDFYVQELTWLVTGLECFVKVVVKFVKYARLAIAEMDISDEELVSSTKKVCGEDCHSECQDLHHEPNYNIQMRVFGAAYNPNPNCDTCFPAFLIKTVIVAIKICTTTLRTYIFSEVFVVGVRDAYIDCAKYYQKCLIKHPNKPPESFASNAIKSS